MFPHPDQVDHLVDDVVGVGPFPGQQLPDPVAIRACRGKQYRRGESALADVRPCGLADGLLVSDQIEGIVCDLEHHAHLPRPGGEGLYHRSVGVGGHRSEAGRGADQ